MEACELERLHAGECKDSLESILLILRQRGMDFLLPEWLAAARGAQRGSELSGGWERAYEW